MEKKKMNEIDVLNVIKIGLEKSGRVFVIGVAQNARTNKPEAVANLVTKVGETCFYIGSKRFRPYLNLTEARIVVESRIPRRNRTRSNR
jgi:hypothetical protein